MTLTELLTLVGAWAALVAAIVYLGEKLDDWWDVDNSRQIGQWLSKQTGRGLTEWALNAIRIFLAIFDGLYLGKQTALERAVWMGLLISPLLVACVHSASIASGSSKSNIDSELLLALILLIVAQLAKLIITRFTPILAFPLQGEGTSSLPLEGES
jgi:hypothetical protein